MTIDRKYHTLIRDTIEEQLQYEPNVETRNRKPLKRPIQIGATWELRLGSKNEFRVFYEIDLTNYQVLILAIGLKLGNQVFIKNEVIEL